jgi:hypothetical protein
MRISFKLGYASLTHRTSHASTFVETRPAFLVTLSAFPQRDYSVGPVTDMKKEIKTSLLRIIIVNYPATRRTRNKIGLSRSQLQPTYHDSKEPRQYDNRNSDSIGLAQIFFNFHHSTRIRKLPQARAEAATIASLPVDPRERPSFPAVGVLNQNLFFS